jgi:NADPH2:quinone reductase
MQPGDGSLGSVGSVPEADVVVLEQDVPANLVAALGLTAIAAWMALTWRGELEAGEQVIVLGAGGVVGQVAVQVARARGARRVLAGCRSRRRGRTSHPPRCGRGRAARHGDVDALASRFTAVADGPVDLVLDPLFGAPAAAAMRTLGPHGRLVNLGGSASPTALIDSATLRSKPVRLLGYTNNELTADQRRLALREIIGLAAAGELSVDFEAVALDRVPEARSRQANGTAAKRLVVDFTASV